VESTPGEGSRFEVWLPCLATAMPALEVDEPARPLGCGETVLMVAHDDARLMRDEEILAALGYEPVGFTAAGAALAACRAAPERFDVLIVGHLGSVKSSLELAAALHKAAPHLPIVLATKSTEEIDADRLMFAGIVDVTHWPIVAAEIAAALNRCSQLTRPGANPLPDSSRGAYGLAH
jgi:DNA-binding NtrC family response regulator